MAQDLTLSKTNFAQGIQTIADRLLALVRDCDEMNSAYFARGFNSGGANAFAQGDLSGANSHLTPTIIGNVITQIQVASSAITSGGRDVLRSTLNNPGLP
jgi:hypothetical protein